MSRQKHISFSTFENGPLKVDSPVVSRKNAIVVTCFGNHIEARIQSRFLDEFAERLAASGGKIQEDATWGEELANSVYEDVVNLHIDGTDTHGAVSASHESSGGLGRVHQSPAKMTSKEFLRVACSGGKSAAKRSWVAETETELGIWVRLRFMFCSMALTTCMGFQ